MRGFKQLQLVLGAALLALACAFVLASEATASQGVLYAFTNFVGQPGVSGQADGTGRAARFDGPFFLAVAGDGVLYVADTYNNTIRRVSPSGAVTTLAGMPGETGSADGAGAAARFLHPEGIALNSAGNLLVADSENSTIRMVTPGGVVTTLAGAPGEFGCVDARGSAARFYYPSGLAVDAADNVYIADRFNYAIRKMAPDGNVTTLAGSAGQHGHADGVGSEASFQRPTGVAVDGAGNVYVADYWNNLIRKITPAGVVTTFAGTWGLWGGADGPPGVGEFYLPSDLVVDRLGNLYVVDQSNPAIRKVTPDGVVTTLAGGTAGTSDGIGRGAQFYSPTGLALDRLGYIYVADTVNHRITKGLPIPTFTASAISTGAVTWTLDGLLGGATVVTEASTNLHDWLPLQTNTAGPFPSQISVVQSLPAAGGNQFLRARARISE